MRGSYGPPIGSLPEPMAATGALRRWPRRSSRTSRSSRRAPAEPVVAQRADRAVVGLGRRGVAAVEGELVALRAVRAGQVEVALLGVDDRVGGRWGGGVAEAHGGGEEEGGEAHASTVAAPASGVVILAT